MKDNEHELGRRYTIHPSAEDIRIAKKALQYKLWMLTGTTPRRVKIRRWLSRRKHRILMFYYRHFRRFRIWYHKRVCKRGCSWHTKEEER
jgi:hypothetical protein